MKHLQVTFGGMVRKAYCLPFTVAETTDAFEDPYAIWDNRKREYFIDQDGTIPTFKSRKEAETDCGRRNARKMKTA